MSTTGKRTTGDWLWRFFQPKQAPSKAAVCSRVDLQIVINHLTRMQSGFICVAGVNLANHQHVRPVVRGVGLPVQLLACNGGPFEIGATVNLGPTKRVGQRPAVEDYLFAAPKTVTLEHTAPQAFWTMLEKVAKPRLLEIFGNELTPRGSQSAGVDASHGTRTLGCLIPKDCGDLYIRSKTGKPDQIRLRLTDGDFDLDLGVTDIRLYGSDHLTPDAQRVQRLADRLKTGPSVILSVGLTRPYAPTAGQPPVHWLQVNNIHFQEEPYWQ